MKTAFNRIGPWDPPDVSDPVRTQVPSKVPSVPVVTPASPQAAFPSWTAADLAAACEEARREGAALAEQTETARATRILERIAFALSAGVDGAAKLAERQATALAELIVQAVAAAFPALEARFGPAESASLIQALLPGLSREPAVSVRISPGGADAVATQLACLPGSQLVKIEMDPTLGDSDVRVTWRDGQAIRDGAAIRASVLAALARLADGDGTDGREA